MPSLDLFREITNTIRKNRLRTFLTGFSVAWGIFILIILLGAGTGLENGIRKEFEGDAINLVWVWGGKTETPYRGMGKERQISLTLEDYERTKEVNQPEIAAIDARVWVGWEPMSWKNNFGSYDIMGATPYVRHIEKLEIVNGRFLNQTDIEQRRKVTVIGSHVKNTIFRERDAIGEHLKVRGLMFEVVGVFEDAYEWDQKRIYVPLSVAQTVLRKTKNINNISITTPDMNYEQSQKLVSSIRRQFALAHIFHPADERALGVFNVMEFYQRFQNLFRGIRIFVAVISVLTIVAGVVGVSNIMIISVKERRKEFGIRKAIGATPASIIGLVVAESVIITSVAGYFGLVAGVGVLELASKFLPQNSYFINPGVEMGTAFFALAVLVAGGVIAGLYPAGRAAAVKPVEALRDE